MPSTSPLAAYQSAVDAQLFVADAAQLQAAQALQACFEGLHQPAAGKPLGVYTIVLTRWAALYPVNGPRWLDLSGFPALQALARAQEARVETPVIARAEGLGPHPFTRPEQPNPPEGSVL